MTNLLLDLRFAARTLARSPGFTVVAVVILAIGIGATTALFSLVDAVLLRPLPYKEPHRLVEIWGRDDRRTGMRVPRAILDALRTHARTLQAVGTHSPSGAVVRHRDEPLDIRGEAVSDNFVDVFGVQPLAGRGFVPEDELPGASPVTLVSFSFWQRYLGGSNEAIGRSVFLDAVPYTVVGIMPPEFRTTFLGSSSDFWTPYAGNRAHEFEREIGYEVVARLSPGATVQQARLEIDAIAAAAAGDEWRKAGRRVGLVPLRQEVVGDRAYALTLLLAAVGLVLAVACANLAQLLLARSDRRLREFATRKALGAAPRQLFRLAICESLLLSLAGGGTGIVIAYWLVPVMLALAPTQIPRLVEASIDARVLAAAFGISLMTGIAFGLAPGIRLSRLSVVQAAKPTSGMASIQRARARAALVVGQVAGAVILFSLAGLVVRTFLTLLPASPGFTTDSRWTFLWSLSERQFPDVADRRARLDDWMQQVVAMPGVQAAAVASGIPFGDDEPHVVPVRLPDDLRPANEVALRAEVRGVSDTFLQLLEIPLIRGRAFAASDRADATRVAIVNQTMARQLEPSSDVIGRVVRVGTAVTSPLYQIIGVVADTRWWGTTLDPLNEVYTPIAQDRASFGYLVVKSDLDAGTLTSTIRRAFNGALPGAALPADRRAVALTELVSRSVAGPRFSATLIGSFSATAFLLAVIGLFGLVACSVAQRWQELGIRTALGATPSDLILSTMRSAMLLTAMGIVLGLAGGAYATRFVRSQLYGIEPLDLATFAGAATAMLAAAAVAAYLPARHAAHADPMASLRHD